MIERCYLRTFVASAEGRRLTVRFPGPTMLSTDMPSDMRARSAADHIKVQGVDCNKDALNRLLNNF